MVVKDALKNFPWPRPAGNGPAPVWTGAGFCIGTEKHRFLAYGVDQSHWSAELTTLHDEEAGADHPIDRASRMAAVDSLRRFISAERPIILDVGCSSGYVLQEIQKALPESSLIGSDYIVEPLAKLCERMPHLPILQFDLRRCPLPDACVEAVTALNVLEHIDRDEEALAQIYRILQPRGIAHVEVPSGPHLYDIYDKHLLHHRRYNLVDLAAMARRVGFEVLKATHLGFFVYPGFALIKKRNKRRAARGQVSDATHRVKMHIRQTNHSVLMRTLTWLERSLAPFMNFPLGIRCVLVLRKP
jgi:ubiquinone/menaquinone biosynthesis C-methylase UbiE